MVSVDMGLGSEQVVNKVPWKLKKRREWHTQACSDSPAGGGGEAVRAENKESVECKIQGWWGRPFHEHQSSEVPTRLVLRRQLSFRRALWLRIHRHSLDLTQTVVFSKVVLQWMGWLPLNSSCQNPVVHLSLEDNSPLKFLYQQSIVLFGLSDAETQTALGTRCTWIAFFWDIGSNSFPPTYLWILLPFPVFLPQLVSFLGAVGKWVSVHNTVSSIFLEVLYSLTLCILWNTSFLTVLLLWDVMHLNWVTVCAVQVPVPLSSVLTFCLCRTELRATAES